MLLLTILLIKLKYYSQEKRWREAVIQTNVIIYFKCSSLSMHSIAPNFPLSLSKYFNHLMNQQK